MPHARHDLEPGDLIACYSPDRAGRLISWATASPFAPRGLRLGPSHVAIVCEHRGRPLWVESTTLCDHPCEITGKPVVGVQAHLPELRLGDYGANGGRVERYRPADVHRLSRSESELLTHILVHHFVGRERPYDMLGAVLSGTRFARRLRRFVGADLSELFCSELVAAVLMRLNRMNHADPALFHPARLLRTLVRSGVYAPSGRLTPSVERSGSAV